MSEQQGLSIEVSAEADYVAVGLTSGSVSMQVVMSRETAAAFAEVLARAAGGQEVGDEE